MNSKQDILNAFREHLDTLMLIASCQPEYYTEKEMKADNKISIDKFLEQTVTPTLTEFEREIYKEVDKKIWEVIDTRMEHVDDGIYDWKVNPKDTFFADDLKNELKNITFELEKEKHT